MYLVRITVDYFRSPAVFSSVTSQWILIIFGKNYSRLSQNSSNNFFCHYSADTHNIWLELLKIISEVEQYFILLPFNG